MCKILLIEDDKVDARLITKKLNIFKDDYHFSIVHDKNAFLDIIQEKSFDIVVSDYKLDIDFTALDVVYELRNIGIETPIIVITSVIGDEKAAELMRNGATDLILKDNLEKLHEVIQREVEIVKYRLSQSQIMKEVNMVLFKLAEAVNWIMKNPLSHISFSRLLKDFSLLLNIDRSVLIDFIFDEHGIITDTQTKAIWKQSESDDKKQCLIDNCFNEELFNQNVVKPLINGDIVIGDIHSNNEKIKEILSIHEINSFIYIPIFKPDESYIYGFIGFECYEDRIWSETEINVLSLIAAIFGTLIYRLELQMKEDMKTQEQINMLRNTSDTLEKLIHQSESSRR